MLATFAANDWFAISIRGATLSIARQRSLSACDISAPPSGSSVVSSAPLPPQPTRIKQLSPWAAAIANKFFRNIIPNTLVWRAEARESKQAPFPFGLRAINGHPQ